MDAVKKVPMTQNELKALGYEIKVSPGGYQALYDSEVIDQWTNPGKFVLESDGSSSVKEFYESMAWEKVKQHYRENSSIAVFEVGDEFEIWEGKTYRVEKIEEEMLHCVMVLPVAPAGEAVTRKFKVSDLIVAVDLEIKEEKQ